MSWGLPSAVLSLALPSASRIGVWLPRIVILSPEIGAGLASPNQKVAVSLGRPVYPL